MKYCPECGIKLEEINGHYETNKAKKPSHKRSGFLTAAGVLAIVAACMCFIIGIIGILLFIQGEYTYGPYGEHIHRPGHLLAGLFGFFAFSFGLTSGILILKRKIFSLVMIGLTSMIAASILLVIVNLISFVLLGTPTIVTVVISTVFTGVSKKEFVS